MRAPMRRANCLIVGRVMYLVVWAPLGGRFCIGRFLVRKFVWRFVWVVFGGRFWVMILYGRFLPLTLPPKDTVKVIRATKPPGACP